MRLIIGIILLEAALSGGAASAQSFDIRSECAAAVGAFDDEDAAKVADAARVVRNVFAEMDAARIARGQPGIIAPMTDDAVDRLVAVAIAFCREHPTATLSSQAAAVYLGTLDLQTELGVIK